MRSSGLAALVFPLLLAACGDAKSVANDYLASKKSADGTPAPKPTTDQKPDPMTPSTPSPTTPSPTTPSPDPSPTTPAPTPTKPTPTPTDPMMPTTPAPSAGNADEGKKIISGVCSDCHKAGEAAEKVTLNAAVISRLDTAITGKNKGFHTAYKKHFSGDDRKNLEAALKLIK